MTPQPRILYIMREPVENAGYGMQQRVAAQCQALAQLGALDTVLITGRQIDPALWPAQLGRLAGTIPFPDFRANAGIFHRLTGNPNTAVFAASAFRSLPSLYRPSREILARLEQLNPRAYDLVFISRLEVAWGLGWRDPRRTVVDIDDVPSQASLFLPPNAGFKTRMLSRMRRRRVRQAERQSLADFRLALVCSATDRDYLGGHGRVAVQPNCFHPQPEMDLPPDDGRPGNMLVLGYMGRDPQLSLAWFFEKVLPLIRAQIPDAQATVAGGALASVAPGPGVRVLGRVDNVATHIRDAAIEICPLLEGMGTRIKIIESLAFAKPVVSTSVGAYGHPMTEDQGLFRRDDAEAFAAACVTLLRDAALRRRLGDAGRQFVNANLSLAATQRNLTELVRPILAGA